MSAIPSSEIARYIIADDHELARAGLRSMLAGEADLQLVGEATNGREAVDLCQRLQPNLVLLDVRMPVMDGLAAAHTIKETCPDTSVLIVTMYENPDYLLEAFKAGAAGYILKDVSRRELITAVRQVLRGGSILNEEVVARILRRLATQTPNRTDIPREPLTPREQEVLRLLIQGQTNREIAYALAVSLGTVKVHVQRIISKLGVTDRTQAAVRAVELGLVNPPPGNKE